MEHFVPAEYPCWHVLVSLRLHLLQWYSLPLGDNAVGRLVLHYDIDVPLLVDKGACCLRYGWYHSYQACLLPREEHLDCNLTLAWKDDAECSNDL